MSESRMDRVLTLPEEVTIRIGVSACLVGDKVRYDGKDKRNAYITDTLARVFELVPVCPEVAIGMGVPRPPIRLVGGLHTPRALGVDDPSIDASEALIAYGRRMAMALDDISGYIFKARSPSCGPWRVPVHTGGASTAEGVGLYAREIMTQMPMMPVEEEERLVDPALRDNFLERVFIYHCWQQSQMSK